MVWPGARTLELGDAALHLRARVRELLGHVGEAAREAAELVVGREDGFGGQVAGGHLAHAVGQQQQGFHELDAEHQRQQHGAEDGQHQRQRQRADVHAAQAVARQRALLVLAVGRLHGQRVGSQRARQRHRHEQEALLGALQPDLGAGQRHQRADARRGQRGGRERFLVQALDLLPHAAGARLAQQQRARAFGRDGAGAAARRHQHLPAGIDDRNLARRHLFAQALQCQRQAAAAGVRQPLRRQLSLVGDVVAQRVERALAQAQAGVQRTGDAHVEPGLDAARDELVGHRVDHHARQQPHQREDARQLDEQPAAELAALQARGQAHCSRGDDQQQQGRDTGVDPEQPLEVALVEDAAARGQRQHEGQHQRHADDSDHRHEPGPAGRLRHGGGTFSSRSMRITQSGCPPRPICIGLGSCVVSSR